MKLSIRLKRPQSSTVVNALVTNSAPRTDLQFLMDFLTLDIDQDPCSMGYAKIHQGFVNSVLLHTSIELLKNPDLFADLFECTNLSQETILASAERFIIASSDHFSKTSCDPGELFNVGIQSHYSVI